MADKTGISWTEATWNPVSGCSRVSAGCMHCLGPDTPILMADLTWRRIAEVAEGDEIVGFTEKPGFGQNRVYERAKVEHVWFTRSEAVEISLTGRTIVASADHRFLAPNRPYWREAENLSLHSGLIDIATPSWTAEPESSTYLAGYLAGAIGGDGTMRIAGSGKKGTLQSYCRVAVLATDRPILDRMARAFSSLGLSPLMIRPFDGGVSGFHPAGGAKPMLKAETRRMANLMAIRDLAIPERQDRNWQAGFLAGFLDTDGSYCGGNLRFCQVKTNGLLDCAERCISALGYIPQREDFRALQGRSVRLVGDAEEQIRFLSTIRPALARKCTDFYGRRFAGRRVSKKVDGIRRLGMRDLVDIQTTSRTFIANGIATHNCYAETLSHRFGWTTLPWTAANAAANVSLRPSRLSVPLRWERGRDIFVNSTSDLFHAQVPDDFIDQVFAVMALAQRHTFQILTKRPARMAAYLAAPNREILIGRAALPIADANGIDWDYYWRKFSTTHERPRWPLPNVWLGVTAEDQRSADERLPILREIPAVVHFVSAEPLLGPLDLAAHFAARRGAFGQIIVGGESGPGARPMKLEWVRNIAAAADKAGVAFFFKQAGVVLAGELGLKGKGAVMAEWPADLRRHGRPAGWPARSAV